MKYGKHHFCDWCMKGFWDNDLRTSFTLGRQIFCCENCLDNYIYIKNGFKYTSADKR